MPSQRTSLTAALFIFGMVFTGTAAPAATGPAHVLKDINPIPSSNRGSFPHYYHRLGKIALFQAMTPLTGTELWRTDGTEAGTFLVKDIHPGRPDAFYYPGFYTPNDLFVELGDALIFMADDGVHGFELWRSDGTEAGTRIVKDMRPGTLTPFTEFGFSFSDPLLWKPRVVGGTMYFLASDDVHGLELWRTDGTEAGTFLLKDIRPGSRSAFGEFYSFSTELSGQEVGGTFFFQASDGIHGYELWKTDGTPAGTVLVKDVHPGAGDSFLYYFTALGGNLLFRANDGASGWGLWRSDGTEQGTVQITAAIPWPFGTYPFDLIKANGAVYFGISNSGWLYRTDGTHDGTVPVRQFGSAVSLLREWNGTLLFLADDGIHGQELWRSDGTAGGTVLVKDMVPGSASPTSIYYFTQAGNRLFFFANDTVHGYEPWTTDGTEAGTLLLKDITPGPAGSDPYNIVGVDGNVFLFIYDRDYRALRLWKSDGTQTGTRAVQSPPANWDGIGLNGAFLFGADDVLHGAELWRSDGTDAGTTLVKDIHPSFVTEYSGTEFMEVVSIPGNGERMFFRADDGVHGNELWVSDGTASGTRLVKDILPGSSFGSVLSSGIALDGAILFAASDGIHGVELWRSDGTEAGTRMIADIFPGPDQGMQENSTFGRLGDSVYFAANDGVHGRTLWKSNGTEAGTVQVAAIDLRFSFPNAGSSSIYTITIGPTLYFVANDPAHGIELWKSDGTEAGTVLVKDISPGPASSAPSMFTDLHGKLFLIAQDPSHGYEPWLSDGTEAGTYLVKDIFPGRTASHRRFLRPVALNDSIYFTARWDATQGEGLWKTDGTEAGTLLVKNLGPIASSGISGPLTLHDGTLFFMGASSGTFGLWRSDGTEESTLPVKTGLTPSFDLVGVDGGLLFASNAGELGNELWRSDGTESGTVLVQDLFPGPESSIPSYFTRLGNKVIFQANDEIAGYEPWVAYTSILFGRPAQAIEDLKGETKLLRLPLGLEISLTAILNAAARNLSGGRTIQAILSLQAFGRYLDALSPAKIPEASATDLQELTAQIVSLLETSLKPAAPSETTQPETSESPVTSRVRTTIQP